MKGILKSVFVIIGTIVGAGFATGQEIYLFFGRYGKIGFATLVLSSIILGIIIYKTLKYIQINNVDNYEKFIEKIFHKKKSFFTSTISLVVILFLGVCYIVMCSGTGAYFSEELGIPNWVGAIIMSVAATMIFLSKSKGIIRLNEIAMPFLICIILLLAFLNKR